MDRRWMSMSTSRVPLRCRHRTSGIASDKYRFGSHILPILQTAHASSRDCRSPLCLVSTCYSCSCCRFFWIGKVVSQLTEVFSRMCPFPNSSASDVRYAMIVDLRGRPVPRISCHAEGPIYLSDCGRPPLHLWR